MRYLKNVRLGNDNWTFTNGQPNSDKTKSSFKGIDTINADLLFTKLHAYGFSRESLK